MADEPNFNFPALRDAQAKLDEARKRLRTVFDEAGPEYDMTKVKSISGTNEEKVDSIRKDNEEIVALKKKVEGLRDVARSAADLKDEGEQGAGEREFKGTTSGKFESLGELFVKSDAFRNKGTKSTLDVELKTLMTRSAGWPPESIRSGRVELTPQAPAVNVVDYIPSGTVSQQLYKYMEETTFASVDGAGNPTSDALASMTSEGGTFGEAQLALTERSKNVEKVTVWIPVTDEQLEDEPGARDYVQQRLFYMLQKKVDNQVMIGSGTTPQLLGTENVSGIQTQALGSDTTIDAIYKLFTSIRTDGFAEPSVVFINPSKWQNVMLLKTADGQYIWGHPSAVGPQTVWGVPVVQSFSHTSTKAVAGDYRDYSMLFSRRGIDVQTTNAHSTHFIEGKQAIRVDARLVMVHFRPKAFGVVTGL